MADMNDLNGSSVRDGHGRTGRIASVTEDTVGISWHRATGIEAEHQALPTLAESIPENIEVLTLREGWTPLKHLVATQEEQMSTALSIIEDLRAISGEMDSLEEAKKKKTKKQAELAKALKSKKKPAPKKAEPKKPPKKITKKSKPKDTAEVPPRKKIVRKRKPTHKSHYPFKHYTKIGKGPNVEFKTRVVSQKFKWKCKSTGAYQQRCRSKQGHTKLVNIDPGYKQRYNKRYKAWVSGKPQ